MRKGRNLEQFAKRIESHIRKSGQVESMELLVCKLLTGEDVKVAAILAAKWVEWRYGKATETHEHSLKVELNIGDADRIIAGYFIAAGSGQNQAGEGDTGQAEEQTIDILPA
jgi:hypothetical protein